MNDNYDIDTDYEGEQEAQAAVNFAMEAINELESLYEAVQSNTTPAQDRLAKCALDAVVGRFEGSTGLEMMTVALESESDEESKVKGVAKSVGDAIVVAIKHLYAIAKRVVQFLIQFASRSVHQASRLKEQATSIIGQVDDRVDAKSNSPITNSFVLLNLHIDGAAPANLPSFIDSLTKEVVALRPYNCITEISALVDAAKQNKEELITEARKKVHSRLQEASSKCMAKVDAKQAEEFVENPKAAFEYYKSAIYPGNRFVWAEICKEPERVQQYTCSVKKNSLVDITNVKFPSLTVNDIRSIARGVRALCDHVERNAIEVNTLDKLLRDASALATTHPSKSVSSALRPFSTIVKSPYIVFNKLSLSVSKAALIYCTESISKSASDSAK